MMQDRGGFYQSHVPQFSSTSSHTPIMEPPPLCVVLYLLRWSHFMSEYGIVNLKKLLEPILHAAGQNVIRAKFDRSEYLLWMSVTGSLSQACGTELCLTWHKCPLRGMITRFSVEFGSLILSPTPLIRAGVGQTTSGPGERTWHYLAFWP